mmetsp:Transcript_8109/g.13117  ORF Transcript_8109/g.13117 Transcript_8109/m.13117 type:complete len:145 (+) Transcript_8109:136-570(+)|eukprot:CAMPEP_0184657704 /NCGR_PEP_ID=MMETSP0308-20130426/21339_1 /TAXON_ID=38269 /ORGANISM="Gloeochaete witrockiana, Strain SAG 46.84" /LENGTH=144 /DNA_ID=CAMNT_0027095869 /DNA_START=135 /DNA_END=569 /DNA_ORIENTATION=-
MSALPWNDSSNNVGFRENPIEPMMFEAIPTMPSRTSLEMDKKSIQEKQSAYEDSIAKLSRQANFDNNTAAKLSALTGRKQSARNSLENPWVEVFNPGKATHSSEEHYDSLAGAKDTRSIDKILGDAYYTTSPVRKNSVGRKDSM